MTKKILFALIALMFASAASAQHDQYGEWQIYETSYGTSNIYKYYYLKAAGYQGGDMNSPTTLYLNKGGDLNLVFVLDDDASPSVVGVTKFGNHPIVEFEMAFDNGGFGYFTFAELTRLNGSVPYSFVVFDRFKKTEKWDSAGMLKQMANKQRLYVRYKTKNGFYKTKTFNLEGLDAILELL